MRGPDVTSASLRLDGKVALVTGGASGIGEAMVRALHAAGASVAVADMSGAEKQLASELGDRVLAVHVDVTDDAAVGSAVQQAVGEFGGLDVLCNNAGTSGERIAAADYPLDAFDKIVSVNLRGVLSGIRHAVPIMIERGGGSVINTASAAALVATPGRAPYSATKGAVVALTRSVAAEYGRAGIRCNAICPGIIDTPMLRSIEAKTPEQFEQITAFVETATAAGRFGRPEEIAAVAVFLASDESSFLTGAAIPVDGGYTII